MNGYEQGRDAEYAAALQSKIAAFMSTYNANPNDQHTTIFLFPGGLGSALVRAEEPAQDGPPFVYDQLWLDFSILAGALIDMQMQGDEDFQDQYILPDGCVDWLMLKPYNQFIQWCQTNWIDLFVFGWDWRRPAADSVQFFLETFLPAFESATSGLSPLPLDNFWLIGHSFGGIVVKQILNQFNNSYVKKMSGAITVGTPFYGYGGQLHRFFVGESDLNWTEGVQGARIVTEINATLRAGYELLFLDKPTYDANHAAFAKDPEGYDLNGYPSLDAASGQPADPYNPDLGQPQQPPGPNDPVRYLPNDCFDWTYLPLGHAATLATSQTLDASVAGKFWNVRCVQTQYGKVVNGTAVGQTWALVPASFDPDGGPDPITDTRGPGDDTIPAWSARLLGNPNVVTVKNDDIEHMDLMNNADVQTAIARVLFPAGPTRRRLVATAKTVKMPAASRKRLDQFLHDARAIEPTLVGEDRKRAVRQLLKATAKGDPNQLQRLLVRAYMDALKSPSQKRGGGERKTPSAPKRERRK